MLQRMRPRLRHKAPRNPEVCAKSITDPIICHICAPAAVLFTDAFARPPQGTRYDLHGIVVGTQLIPRESFANELHGEKDDNESPAHDEFPPVEVGCPLRPQEVAQLLMDGVMPGVSNSFGLGSGSGGHNILRVAKEVLDLH